MQNFLYIVGGLACIVFLVGVGMSYRTWRIPMLIIVPAVFVAAGFFFYMSVITLKTHQQWGELNIRLQKELDQVTKKNEELEKGIVKGKELLQPGVKQLRQQVVDILRDRGRMWTGAQPAPPDATTGEVQVTVVEPKEHQIKAKTLLYVFEERPLGTGSFLGSFRVSSVVGGDMPMEEMMPETKPEEKPADEKAAGDKPGDKAADKEKGADGKADAKADAKKPAEKPAEKPAPKEGAEGAKGPSVVTLTPTWRPTAEELNRLKASTGPWTLYDKMPPDNHTALVNLDRDPLTGAIKIDSQTNKPIDRVAMLQKLLPPSVLQEYVDDFQPTQKDTPAGRVFVLVEFLKNYALPAAPVAIAPAGAAPAGGFGGAAAPPGGAPAGGAVAGAPANGTAPLAPAPVEPREFKQGASAWLELSEATALKNQSIVKFATPERRRFERELRDYAFLFDVEYQARERLASEMANLERENVAIVAVQEKNTDLVKLASEVQARLTNDLEHFKFEEQAINKHSLALAQQYQALAQQFRTLFLANQELASKIDALQRQAAAAINRRAPAAPQAIGAPTPAAAIK